MRSDSDEAGEWADACEGSSAAFTAVYHRHRERVFRLAFRLSENRHDAEDVTAAAFLELWRRRAAVRIVDGSVLPWLLITVSNAAKNHARSVRRYRRLIESIPRGTDDGSTAFEVADAAIDSAPVLRELRSLPDQDRALLVLTAIEGYPVADAAKVLGIGAGTARMRLHRVRKKVQDAQAQSAQTAPTLLIDERSV